MKFTPEQQAQIETYIKQGLDRQTAERVVRADAKPRKACSVRGDLQPKAFSLLK